MKRWLVLVAWLLLLPAPALAQGGPPRQAVGRHPSAKYWATHGLITGLSLLEAGLIGLKQEPLGYLPPDHFKLCLWGRHTPGAEGAAAAFFAATVATPVVALGALENAGRFGHSMLIYGEAVSLSIALGRTVDHLLGRRRPYTYDPTGKDTGDGNCARLPAGACRSFYSTRVSTAYAAAFSGGYLFSERLLYRYGDTTDANGGWKAPREWQNLTAGAWAFELGFASLTTVLEVKSGRAFYSDALVGMAVGTGIGLGSYVGNRGSLELTPRQALGMLGGAALGLVPPLLLIPVGTSQYGTFLHARLVPFGGPGLGGGVAGEF